MKTQEQQKSELCDEYVNALLSIKSTVELNEMEIVLIKKYNQIAQQKPLSQDPYCDEIFSGRMLTLFRKYHLNKKRLSELPNLISLIHQDGFGRKSVEEYTEVMTTYEMWDKI